MEKFGRIYDLRITTKGGKNIAVTLPFAVDIDLTKATMPTANCLQIRIYSLPRTIRDQIRFDISSISDRQELALRAGYKSLHKNLNDLPLIFMGTIKYAYSERVNNVDWVTIIECYDGGFSIANSRINDSFKRGENYRYAMEKVFAKLEGIRLGRISNKLVPDGDKILREQPVKAKVFDYLNENLSNKWFIDNEIINVLDNDECLEGVFKVVSPETGLISTPRRSETFIDFDMIFEPRLLLGQLINLRSVTDPAFNGTYKLVTIKHRGNISDANSGQLITSCRVFKGTGKLEVVK